MGHEYRRKQKVEAIQYTGDNVSQVMAFISAKRSEASFIKGSERVLIFHESFEKEIYISPTNWVIRSQSDNIIYCYTNEHFELLFEKVVPKICSDCKGVLSLPTPMLDSLYAIYKSAKGVSEMDMFNLGELIQSIKEKK